MRPSRSLPLLISMLVLVVGVYGCNKKEPKQIRVPFQKILPPAADVAVGMDVNAIRGSSLALMIWEIIAQEPGAQEGFRAAASCLPGPTWPRVNVATRYEIAGEQGLIMLQGQGVGTKSFLRCLEKKLAPVLGERSGVVPFTTRDGVLISPQVGSTIILPNHDTIAIVSTGWHKSVFAAMASFEDPKKGAGLSAALTKNLMEADLWAVFSPASFPGFSTAEYPLFEGLEYVSFAFNLDQGMAVDAALAFSKAEQADLFQTSSRTIFSEPGSQGESDHQTVTEAGQERDPFMEELMKGLVQGPTLEGNSIVKFRLKFNDRQLMQLGAVAAENL